MRKIALLLVLVLVASSLSFAQVKKAPAKKAAPAGEEVVEEVVVTEVPAAASSAQGFVGVSLNQLTVPSIRFGLGSWSLDVGLTLSSPAAGQTDYTILLRGEFPLSKVTNKLYTYFAPQVRLENVANQTTTTIFLLLGGEYRFAPHLTVFADLHALTITSTAGTTTWRAGTNVGQIYSGIRLYF